tara:strand:+ start:675 stop:1025 length:351 start_codon:yes stop_codon:yes gene_type:complete
MKTNSKDLFEVICGSYRNSIKIDREVFKSYKDACFEAATQSIEEYFRDTDPTEVATISIFCVIRSPSFVFEKGNQKENDFVILTHTVLRNAGYHDLAKEFERASDVYLSAVNKKEK